jgi:hypothetical protein
MASGEKLLNERERAERALLLGSLLGVWLAIAARLRGSVV